MKLDYSTVGDVTVLEFTGEFDAFNLAPISKAVDEIVGRGEAQVVLDLRLLTFINSSALGYLLQAHKRCVKAGGDLVVARPSKFVRKIMGTLGLDKLVRVYETVEDAVRHFHKGTAASMDLAGERSDEALTGSNTVLFSVGGPDARRHVGKIASLYEQGLKFRFEVPSSSKAPAGDVSTANFENMLSPGTPVHAKFRLPLAAKHKYFEVACKVGNLDKDTRDDGTTEAVVTLVFESGDDDDMQLLRQYSADMQNFRSELEQLGG
jgi:anti-sigma B factor antagonist